MTSLPGADLVQRGIADVTTGRDTVEAALVLMARTRLRAVGFALPERPFSEPAGHRLYDLLSEQDRATAHGRYKALGQRLSSFLDAVDRAGSR